MASPALRCQQTVEPLSQRRAVPIELVDALSVDAPPVRLLQLVTNPGLHQAVLCGHGEQIGLLLGQLADGGLPIEPWYWPKGSTWVLDANDGQVTGARYLAPLRLADLGGCNEPKRSLTQRVRHLAGGIREDHVGLVVFGEVSPTVVERSRAHDPDPARHAAD
jgi:hypothetical protein